MSAGYAPDLRARLLADLARRRAAGESFDAIAATPGWPSRPTLRKWLRQTPDLEVPRLRRAAVRWSPALAAEICDLFEAESLRGICELEGMPDRATLAEWRRKHSDFAARLEAVRHAARQPRTGRRSTFCELIADDVLDAIFEAVSIGAACRDDDMPPSRTVRDWARAHPEFARGVAIAMEMAHARKWAPTVEAVRAWLTDPGAELEDAPLRRRLRK